MPEMLNHQDLHLTDDTASDAAYRDHQRFVVLEHGPENRFVLLDVDNCGWRRRAPFMPLTCGPSVMELPGIEPGSESAQAPRLVARTRRDL